MTRVEASKARDEFSDLVNRAAYRGERIVLRRRGKDVAAIVSLDDLARLERLEREADSRSKRTA